MDVFRLHKRLITDYGAYAGSFIRIADDRIKSQVDEEIKAGLFWPETVLSTILTFRKPIQIESGQCHLLIGKIRSPFKKAADRPIG